MERERERERMRWWIESGGRKEEMRRNLARWREEEKSPFSSFGGTVGWATALPPHFPSLFLG